MANVEAVSDKTIIYDDLRWIDIGEYAPLKNSALLFHKNAGFDL